jgi:hypothetical protein
MSITSVMMDQARAALRDDGSLSESELRALIQKALDRSGGLNREISRALIYLRWHYWRVADVGSRRLLTGFVEAAFQDDIGHVFWAADVFSPKGELAPPPGSPPAPRIDHDPHVVGKWLNSSYLSSGNSSGVITRYRTYGRDGHFADNSQASASSEHFASDGTWTGSTSAMSELSPGERGRWATAKSTLWLRWDDESTAMYRYEAYSDSMLLVPEHGENQLWKRR